VKKRRFNRVKKLQKIKRNKKIFFLVFLSAAFLFFVTSCGKSSPPLPLPLKGKSPAVEKKDLAPVKIVEKKEVEKREDTEYTYNPVGKPDPFTPFIQLTSGKEYSKNILLTPLQKYDISQLKLVAIITTSQGNTALVEDSAGKGYFLKKGTGIGKNDGKVKTILKDRVIIEEAYEDAIGQKKLNEVSLFLHRIEEGGGES
jgi:type IV pilus assembly protein PilP